MDDKFAGAGIGTDESSAEKVVSSNVAYEATGISARDLKFEVKKALKKESASLMTNKSMTATDKLRRADDEVEKMIDDPGVSAETKDSLWKILNDGYDLPLRNRFEKNGEINTELLDAMEESFKSKKEQLMPFKKQQKEKEKARAVTMDRKKAMEGKSAEEMGKYFGKDETSVSKHFDINNKEVVNVDKEKILEARNAEAEKLRIEFIESLGKKMKAAEQKWQKKKIENESFVAKLKGLFISGVTFGEAEKEEERFRLEYEEIKAHYEQIAVDIEEKENDDETDITEKEIEALPEEEKDKMGMGFRNIGFFVEKWKNDLFFRVTRGAVKLEDGEHIADKSSFARFMYSLSENFQKSSDQAKINIEKSNTEDRTSLKQLSNAGYLFGNIIKYGKIAADLLGKTAGSFPRYAMMGAMALGTGADAFKKARLSGAEAMDKTRIMDAEIAYEEADKLYKQAQKGDVNASPTRDEIEKYYQRNIPQDVLKRLETPLSLSACGLLEYCIKKDVSELTDRIAKKLDGIENNPNFSSEKKEQEKDKVQKKYADYLHTFDRLVTQAGEVDVWAMAAQYVKTGAKAVVWGVGLETLILMTQKLVEEAPMIAQKTDDLIKLVGGLVSNQDHHGTSGIVDVAHHAGSTVTNHEAFSGATKVTEAAKSINLNPIENGGDSIESSIRDHFRANPDLIEKYNQLNGGRKFNAGQIAHRMFLEYGNKHDLVHAGAQVNMSADGMRIENVTGDEHMGVLSAEKSGLTPSESPINETTTFSNSAEQGISGDANAYEGFLHQADNYLSSELLADSNALYANHPEFRGVSNFDTEITRLGEEIAGGGNQTNLNEKIQALSELKVLREHFSENYTKIVKLFLDFKKGDSLEALNTTNARDFVRGHSQGNTLKIFKALRATMSADQIKQFKIDPTNSDTILTWSRRVTTFMLKKISEK